MEIIVALVGIGGAFLGAAATRSLAIWSARGTYNIEETRAARTVITEVLSAGDELYITHGAALDHVRAFIAVQHRKSQAGEPYETYYARAPELMDRIQSSTERWRKALSSAHLRLGQELSAAMGDFDRARALFVDHLNANQLDQASAVLDGALENTLRKMKLAADVEGCRINLVIIQQLEPVHVRWRSRRALKARLNAAIARLSEPSGPTGTPLQASAQIDGPAQASS